MTIGTVLLMYIGWLQHGCWILFIPFQCVRVCVCARVCVCVRAGSCMYIRYHMCKMIQGSDMVVGNFPVNPSFLPTDMGRNLCYQGLLQPLIPDSYNYTYCSVMNIATGEQMSDKNPGRDHFPVSLTFAYFGMGICK